MNKYIPHTNTEIQEMLSAIGASNIDSLFADIPDSIRIKEMKLPLQMSEMELVSHTKGLAKHNASTSDMTCFLGAGAYDHYIPSVIDSLVSRQEFYTAYTPYQPEISQGTLQAIFEYQTMICELTGMDVANASMYDGATATAEAMNVACGSSRRNGVLLAGNIHPHTKEVVNTYAKYSDKVVGEISIKDGQVDIDNLASKLDDSIGAVIIQTPNFFGLLESIKEIADIVHSNKAYLIAIADPLTLGILEAPGKLGADIVVGEAQTLGNSLSFGGPYVGYFAATKKLMRKIPGRLVGETVDVDGNRAFVLTIQTREQHIRREKATSNICSNQALCALISCIYMSTMGKEGLKEVGQLCIDKSHYAYDKLIATGKFSPVYSGGFFKEFTLKYNGDLAKLQQYLLEKDILFGYDLSSYDDEMDNCILLAVTEMRTKDEIDTIVKLIEEVAL